MKKRRLIQEKLEAGYMTYVYFIYDIFSVWVAIYERKTDNFDLNHHLGQHQTYVSIIGQSHVKMNATFGTDKYIHCYAIRNSSKMTIFMSLQLMNHTFRHNLT